MYVTYFVTYFWQHFQYIKKSPGLWAYKWHKLITHAVHHPCHASPLPCLSLMPLLIIHAISHHPMPLLITHVIAHHSCHCSSPMPFPTTHAISHHPCHCSSLMSLPITHTITTRAIAHHSCHCQARIQRGGGGGRTLTFICTNFFKKSPKLAKKILGASTPNPLRPLLFQITDPPLIAHHQCHCLSPRF